MDVRGRERDKASLPEEKNMNAHEPEKTTLGARTGLLPGARGIHAVSVRPVSSGDRERLAGMLARLSGRTIYERFHAPYPRVPGWLLAGMLEVDHRDREALLAVAGGEIVGHAMYAREGKSAEAEFAVVVEDGWRSRGIGKLLLCELAAEAGRRGIETFTGSVLGENRRALAALAAVFLEMRYEMRGGEYQVRVPLRPETACEGAA
jgi:GNAT superfamily N-acetyltransferase